MNNPQPEPLSKNEMDKFKTIKDVRVVIDVGARTSLDYLDVHPNAEYHLFEPNPDFCEYLQYKTSGMPNVRVNRFALGDSEGFHFYDNRLQAMEGAERTIQKKDAEYPMRTLDQYVQEHNITRIDFLKVDTEGYDYKVLVGGANAVKMARFIQFEHWNNVELFQNFLGSEFVLEDIGGRNYFCTRIV